jgi:hypothetical protein
MNRPRLAQNSPVHHRDPVTHAKEFRKITAYHQNASWLLSFSLISSCELIYQIIDLRFTSYVNTARRFIKQKNVNVLMQEARDCHLLLISSGKIPDALPGTPASDPETRDPLIADRVMAGWKHEPERPCLLSEVHHDVISDVQ